MTSTDQNAPTQQEEWTPPERPEWVQQLNTRAGDLDLGGLVPLDGQSLIATAKANTGLDDFGADDWREPFAIFLQSLETEANLNFTGRLMARADILRLLEGRLKVEHAYREHPEIEQEEIVAPIFIVGQGRTGTSILQKLLGLDPGNRTLMTWEAMFPVDDAPVEERIAKADAHFALWVSAAPTLARIHDWGGGEPIETILAEAMSFQCPAWLNLLGLTPSYNAAIGDAERLNSLSYARRVLKLRQWQTPGKRWVIKSPDATAYLPSLLKIFPDARLIWPHRDPLRALASAVNMIGTFVWARSDVLPSASIFNFMTDPETSAQRLTRPIEWIENGDIPKDQIANIRYDELVADPLAALEKTYAQINLELDADGRKAISAYFAEHPMSERKPHVYATGQAENIARQRPYFQRYQSYFDIPSEL